MPLTPEQATLKARCLRALLWNASLAYVDQHLETIEADPLPEGVRPEQHLLDTLQAIEAGSFRAERLTKKEFPKSKKGKEKPVEVAPPPPAPAPVIEAPPPPVAEVAPPEKPVEETPAVVEVVPPATEVPAS